MRHGHKLLWNDGNNICCKECIMNDIHRICENNNAIFYVKDALDGRKKEYLRGMFPDLKITSYNCVKLMNIPTNISCPYKDHGDRCAYKKCLALCQDYVANK